MRVFQCIATVTLCLVLCSCGSVAIKTRTVSISGPSNWRFVSEWQPIQNLALGGGELWAVTPVGLQRTSVEGTDDWTLIEGLVTEGEEAPFSVLLADPAGELWIGGEEFLVLISAGTATRFSTIEKILGTVTVLEQSVEGVVWAGSGGRIAVREGQEWQVLELPFEAGLSTSLDEALWVTAGEQGVVRIEGDSVGEFADPLRDFEPVSVAVVDGEVCVLWGEDTAHLSFLRDETWHVYAVPAMAGKAVRMYDAGGAALLETDVGLFTIASRQAQGMIPLVALSEPVDAKSMGYIVEPQKPREDAEPPSRPPKLEKPRPRRATVGSGGELPARGIVNIKADLWSPVTAVAGDGEYVVVGTETTGSFVLRDSVLVDEITDYGVQPRTPVSKLPMSDGHFYYVLADDVRAGVVYKGGFSSEPITANEHERLLAFDVRRGSGYAMSLVKEFETVQFFTYKDGAFVKLLDRTVDLASGISDIGGFMVHTDGSFWFTILSAAEGLEMGVAAVHEDKEEIVFHGSMPQPPELAAKIPNGVSLIEATPDGDIWLGGMEGAVRLDPDLNPTVYREPQGLVGDMVSDMALDGDGALWALTADGLGWFEDDDWHFPDKHPFRGNVISCIGIDADGSLLIADEEAVRRKSGDGWDDVIALEVLPGRNVLDVTEGAGGRLWVVTDRAIAIEPQQ